MDDNSQKQSLAQQLLLAAGGLSNAIRVLQETDRNLAAKKPVRAHSDEVIVSVQHVSKHYKMGRNTVRALEDVSLDIYRGEFVAITGTSGSGKSTLLQLIGGLDTAKTGSITVNGQNLAKLSDGKLSRFRNHTIGFVFQFFYLQPFLNLKTNVEVPAMFARSKRPLRRQRSQLLIEKVGLSDRLRHLPRELSGGQMQRTAIARALQNQPAILLADEPTGNLDHANAQAIFKLFDAIRTEQGTTIIVVTHDFELASMADRSIVMRDGQAVL